jgi:hypothetical protein
MHDVQPINHIVRAAVVQTRIRIGPQVVLTIHQTHQLWILPATLLDFSRSPRQRKHATANNLVTQILNLPGKLRHQMLVLWYWSITRFPVNCNPATGKVRSIPIGTDTLRTVDVQTL